MTNKPVITSRRKGRTGALLAATLVSAALVGCTVLSSELPSQLANDGRAPEGVHYYLPKSLVDVTLTAVGSYR